MWLTDVSIRRPVFITMVVLALIILGLQARKQMPTELIPKIDFPFISIVTVYPGAGPQEIETLVSEPIEEAVGSTGNLRNITSSSQDGVSAVGMELELGTDLNAAAADVRDKLTAARASLPRDINEPSIIKADITARPVMTLALGGKLSGRDMRILADKTIKDRLARVDGVAAVYVSGGQVREFSVAVDRDRLQAYGMTIDEVAQALGAENLNLPSGSVKEGAGGRAARNYAVRTVGELRSADEIANLRINLPGSRGTVRLGDIATVRDTVQEPDTLTRLNGRDSVIMAIQQQSNANTVTVADGVRDEINRLNGYTKVDKLFGLFPVRKTHVKGQLPEGTELITTTDESEFVKDALSDVYTALIEGVILVVLVVFLFLHTGRATLIVALAIPTSLIATFLPIRFFGFSMNMMTMLALALSVGILVDDSIVVLENIERHLRLGEPPRQAALNGRSEIGLAAITITLVDVVVFVPIAFMGGIVGQFFRQFGITVATATLFSLFMSFTLTPMLASRWLRSKEERASGLEPARNRLRGQTEGFFGRLFARFDIFYAALDRRYRGVLAWALENRALTITIGVVTLIVVLGMLLPAPLGSHGAGARMVDPRKLVIAVLAVVLPVIAVRKTKARSVGYGFAALMVLLTLFVHIPLGGEMMPAVDRGEFAVSVELPAGTGLDATDRVVRQVEALLAKTRGMEYYQSTVGASSTGSVIGGGSIGSQYARISAKLVDRTKREKSVQDIVAELNEKTALIPGGELRLASSEGMGPPGQQITMEITGSDMKELVRVSDQVVGVMRKIPGAIDIQNSWDVGKPELRVTVDRLRSADLGVSVAQVATALRTSIEGNTDSKLREAGEQYDIRVRLAKLDRNSTSDVSNVIVGHRNGTPIYLRDVASVALAAAPNKIDRKNRQRLITVGSNIAPGYDLGSLQGAVNRAIIRIPTGTARIATGGMGELYAESFGYMISALFLAIALVYMLMGALFESFATPLVIMFSLPQAMIGALLALMLTGYTLSIISMIGIIMLTGLVTKNAILMVDYTNTLRSRGKERNEAILEAGPTRLRPVLMTTFAMIGGMLPTALAATRGSEMRAPMAVAVIGGLVLATLLTLLVIPSVYTLVDDWTTAAKRRLSSGQAHQERQASTLPGVGPDGGSV